MSHGRAALAALVRGGWVAWLGHVPVALWIFGGLLFGGRVLCFRDLSIYYYPNYLFHSIHQSPDDWAPWIELCRIMDADNTSTADFDRQVEDILDVERFLRVIATRIMIFDWDALFVGLSHNAYFVFDDTTGLWSILPFDMDTSFGLPTHILAIHAPIALVPIVLTT